MQPISEKTQFLTDVDSVAAAVVEFTWPGEQRADRIGLEVEAMPIWVRSGRTEGRVPLSTVREIVESAPVPGEGRLTLEPGGQLEYSSAPHADLEAVMAEVDGAWDHVESRFEEASADLVPFGIDPWHAVSEVPQQLTAGLYVAMDRFYSHSWPAGAPQPGRPVEPSPGR
jgi:glutamate--cysteine ligase